MSVSLLDLILAGSGKDLRTTTGRSPALSESAVAGNDLVQMVRSEEDEIKRKAAQAIFDNALAQARYQGMQRGVDDEGSCVASAHSGELRCLVGASCEDAIDSGPASPQWHEIRGTDVGQLLVALHDCEPSSELSETDFLAFANKHGLVYTDPLKAERAGYPTAPLGGGS